MMAMDSRSDELKSLSSIFIGLSTSNGSTSYTNISLLAIFTVLTALLTLADFFGPELFSLKSWP